MTSIPIYDAAAPIACTAASDELAVRIEQLEQMRARLARIERTDDGLLLHFPNGDDIDAQVRRFTLDEKGCCQFWGFAIDTTGDDLTLRWDGPPNVSAFMDELHTFFESDQPLTTFSGLL